MPVPDFCFVLSALRGTVICLSFWGTLSPEAAVMEHPDDPGFAQGPLWVYHRLGAAGRVGVAGASERRAEHAPGPTVAPETRYVACSMHFAASQFVLGWRVAIVSCMRA